MTSLKTPYCDKRWHLIKPLPFYLYLFFGEAVSSKRWDHSRSTAQPQQTKRLLEPLCELNKAQKGTQSHLADFFRCQNCWTHQLQSKVHCSSTLTDAHTCIVVSSASLHKGHIGSVDIFITDKCLLRAISPVMSPTISRNSFLSLCYMKNNTNIERNWQWKIS